jgi:hypothetical protein
VTREGNGLTRELTNGDYRMLVAVKTETLVNTPWDATLVPRSVSCTLNRAETLSAAREKTCFNFSKGRRICVKTPALDNTHNRHASAWKTRC